MILGLLVKSTSPLRFLSPLLWCEHHNSYQSSIALCFLKRKYIPTTVWTIYYVSPYVWIIANWNNHFVLLLVETKWNFCDAIIGRHLTTQITSHLVWRRHSLCRSLSAKGLSTKNKTFWHNVNYLWIFEVGHCGPLCMLVDYSYFLNE
jgi:hypothetical protein